MSLGEIFLSTDLTKSIMQVFKNCSCSHPHFQAKCGFTITVNLAPTTTTTTTTPATTTTTGLTTTAAANNSRGRGGHNSRYNHLCDKVPQIENGRMTCVRVGVGGKKCSPSCSPGHVFYQKFHQRRRPSYLCNAHRVDWKVRRFIPDCSPVHPLGYNDCEAGWEKRDDGGQTCVACPPGMYRKDPGLLCQLCPKGMYADQFGSSVCKRCPLGQTTRGLGARRSTDCTYGRRRHGGSAGGGGGGRRQQSNFAARTLAARRQERKRNRMGFMYYNKWT